MREPGSHVCASDLIDLSGREARASLIAQPRGVWANHFRDSRRVREGKIYPAMTFLGLGFPVIGPWMLAAELLSDRSADAALMSPHRMIVVAAKLLRGKLPVRLERPFVRTRQRHHPALGAVELQIQVPAKISQILIQGDRMLIQARENQPMIGTDFGRPQQWPFLALEIPVVSLAIVGHSGKASFKIVGPSMV